MANEFGTINSASKISISKLIVATRDLTAASGDVAYTGVGFTPTGIIVNFNVDAGLLGQGTGLGDSALDGACSYWYNATSVYHIAELIRVYTHANNAQTAIIKSYDADGFTLTWVKLNTPSAGTLTMRFLPMR